MSRCIQRRPEEKISTLEVEVHGVKTRSSVDIVILAAVLAALAFSAQIRGSVDETIPPQPTPPLQIKLATDEETPRIKIQVDGVSLGGTEKEVLAQWPTATHRFGDEWIVVEDSESQRSITLGRRSAQLEQGSVSQVHGQRLLIEGLPSIGTGDLPTKILNLFGEPDPNIFVTQGCGNPGPMKRWNYRRHGVIISFVVPNEDFWREAFKKSPPADAKGLTFEEIKMKEPLLSEIQEVAIYRNAIE